MSKLNAAKLVVDIAEVASKIYATAVEKSRERADKDVRIKELEAELEKLKAKSS